MFVEKLKELLQGDNNEYTVEELLEYFGESTLIIGFVIATIITSLPLPPWGFGFETLPGGFLCIFFAIQGILGFEYAYLPDFIKKQTVNIEILKESKFMESSLNFIDEHLESGRYPWALNQISEISMYVLILANAILMILPIVFTNGLPSQCITGISIAWLLGDGLYFLIMLAICALIFFGYIFLFLVFGKWLYRTRKTWSFGILGRTR